jgi:hypothetical protein
MVIGGELRSISLIGLKSIDAVGKFQDQSDDYFSIMLLMNFF